MPQKILHSAYSFLVIPHLWDRDIEVIRYMCHVGIAEPVIPEFIVDRLFKFKFANHIKIRKISTLKIAKFRGVRQGRV